MCSKSMQYLATASTPGTRRVFFFPVELRAEIKTRNETIFFAISRTQKDLSRFNGTQAELTSPLLSREIREWEKKRESERERERDEGREMGREGGREWVKASCNQ